VATVFLTGRECPWRCTMCDLWKYTIAADTSQGAIPAQIAGARVELRRHLPPVTTLKLYNAGSFFDPRAVPESDYDAIARNLAGLDRIIVESHPALIGPRVEALLGALDRVGAPALEVAMGLETANPLALDALNKRFTVEEFQSAAAWLRARSIALRVFVLISPPFLMDAEQDAWLTESIDHACVSGASVVALIPTRSGNGAMEALAASGQFSEPALEDIERSLAIGLTAAGGRSRIFVDLWDLSRFALCEACFETRKARLHSINLTQTVAAASAPCDRCGATSS
jgi:radical SAM enzyme (TIGR01210 family)